MGRVPREALWAISQLQADRRILGRCPHCDEEYPMTDWGLFYGDSFPEDAKEVVNAILSIPDELKKQFADLKRASTIGAAQGSVRVKMGQTVEQIVTSLPTFPYRKSDCRSLFKPIDYLVFEGLTDHGQVKGIHFVDIKTGDAKMLPHEKQVKRIVDKRRVEFARY